MMANDKILYKKTQECSLENGQKNRFHLKGHTDGKQAHEIMSNIISQQENAN